ncbi:MAG: DUF11 domain-containing protein [Caldilineales bacterium]|nr:DUF11 domain-containing protein [Caldilineales bacterium]
MISLIMGGLVPVQTAQAATKMATADAVESQGRMAEMAGGQRREQGRSEADEEAASLTVDISQEAEPAVVAPGEVVTYTVTARHTGYGLLRDLVVSDALPAGLVLVPHSESGFGYDPGAKTPGACWPKSYVRAIHLDRIEYDNSNVQIDFVYAPRLDFPEGYDQQLWRFYTQNRLQQLWVKAKSGGSYQTLRSYYLEYDSGPNPYVSQKVSNLTFIEQTANGQVMPRVEFGYSDSGFASQDEYGAMTWIKNGYGGEIAFSSDHRGSGATPHVLASMSLRSGMAGATEAVWRYQGYDWDASGEADKLAGGFKRMDVIGPDGSLTRYEFETILDVGGKFDHLAGRVKTVQVCDDANCGSGHVLSRLETTWLHQLPANYPHLSNYGSLAAKDQPKFVYKEVEIAFKGEEEQSKTVLKYQDFRQKDEANVSRQYGNLTEMQEIEWDANTGGWKSAPYRTTYSVFYPATSAWIIDKPGLQEVFRKTWDDPSGQRLVQTFLFYDQTSNYQVRPSQIRAGGRL